MGIFNLFRKQKRVGEDLRQIENMFDEMQNKTGWDVSKKMLFNYFFLHPAKSDLEKLSNYLEKQGFTTTIEEIKPDELFKLTAEEKIKHTPQSLVERNKHFNDLALKFKIMCYDGYDVGPISE